MPHASLQRIHVKFVAGGRTRAILEIAPLEPLSSTTPLIVNFTGGLAGLRVLNGKALGFAHTPSGFSLAMYSQTAFGGKGPRERAPAASG